LNLGRKEGALIAALAALVTLIALAALGTFLMYAIGEGEAPASMPSFVSPIMLAGAICLLVAEYSGVVLLRVNNEGRGRNGLRG